jgi:hypothetical protein
VDGPCLTWRRGAQGAVVGVVAFDGGSVGPPRSRAERYCEMVMVRKQGLVGLLDKLLQRICWKPGARGGGVKPRAVVAVSVGGDGSGRCS